MKKDESVILRASVLLPSQREETPESISKLNTQFKQSSFTVKKPDYQKPDYRSFSPHKNPALPSINNVSL